MNSEALPPTAKTYRKVLFQQQSDFIQTGIYDRSQMTPGTLLEGPAIIEQMDTTVVVPPQWRVETDGYQNLILTEVK